MGEKLSAVNKKTVGIYKKSRFYQNLKISQK